MALFVVKFDLFRNEEWYVEAFSMNGAIDALRKRLNTEDLQHFRSIAMVHNVGEVLRHE